MEEIETRNHAQVDAGHAPRLPRAAPPGGRGPGGGLCRGRAAAARRVLYSLPVPRAAAFCHVAARAARAARGARPARAAAPPGAARAWRGAWRSRAACPSRSGSTSGTRAGHHPPRQAQPPRGAARRPCRRIIGRQLWTWRNCGMRLSACWRRRHAAEVQRIFSDHSCGHYKEIGIAKHRVLLFFLSTRRTHCACVRRRE